MKSWVLGQPCLDVGVLVSAVVIADHVDLQFFGYLAVDDAQKLQEFSVAEPGQAAANHDSREHIQRGEERGGAVAFVVMGHRTRPAFCHR